MSAAVQFAGVAAQATGGLALDLNGTPVVCRPSGALWVEAARALIVADLHLEKGSFFATGGQMLPPYDSADTLRRLADEDAALTPDEIVLLGDSFHDRDGDVRLAEGDRETLNMLASRATLTWVTGNHDPLAPRDLPGKATATRAIGPLTLVHEPHAGDAPGEVAGHLHPCARVKSRIGGVRRRCFVTDGVRIVLPAFGALTGGLNVRDAAFGALFSRTRRPLAAVLGADRVHPVGWAALRGD